MSTVAIICEYNPLTNGHVKHLELARKETNCNTVLCVMSGSFTQRGDAAIADKYLRAEQAILHGADIVIELPTLFAISPADNFAYGAIKTLSNFPDVEYISFGSETGNLDDLIKIANFLNDEPEEYKKELHSNLKKGLSFPKARAMAFKEYTKTNKTYENLEDILNQPNNVLGIAYIIAAMRLEYSVKFHTIKRIGAGYNEETIEKDFSSATAIRRAFKEGKNKEVQIQVPKSTFNMLVKYKPQDDALGSMVLFKLKTISGFELENYYDVTGGIHNRLKIAAANAVSIEEALSAAKTKNYTMARLKRICLYALFDITQSDYLHALSCPPYVQILAIRSDRRDDLLPKIYRYSSNVLTRYSDVSRVDKSLRPLIRLDFAAQGTLSLANKVNYLNRKMLIVTPE